MSLTIRRGDFVLIQPTPLSYITPDLGTLRPMCNLVLELDDILNPSDKRDKLLWVLCDGKAHTIHAWNIVRRVNPWEDFIAITLKEMSWRPQLPIPVPPPLEERFSHTQPQPKAPETKPPTLHQEIKQNLGTIDLKKAKY